MWQPMPRCLVLSWKTGLPQYARHVDYHNKTQQGDHNKCGDLVTDK